MKKAVCAVYENMWRSGLRAETRWVANSALQSPSLHTRIGVLKCSKTHLQQTRISKIFRGQTPGPLRLDPPLNTMNMAANCLTPALIRGPIFFLNRARFRLNPALDAMDWISLRMP